MLPSVRDSCLSCYYELTVVSSETLPGGIVSVPLEGKGTEKGPHKNHQNDVALLIRTASQ